MNKLFTLLLFLIPVSNGFSSKESHDCPNCPPYRLYEGDILELDNYDDRNAVADPERRWPNGVIPYVIDSNLAQHKDLILMAMQHFQVNTCIRFVPRTHERNYVWIFSGDGCYSNVGRIGGKQRLSLTDWCYNFPAVVHELGHTVGFYHEHSRSDRDQYVKIFWENIRNREYNFRKLESWENLLFDKFDYDSIMLYDETILTTDGKEVKILEAKQKGIRWKRNRDKKGLSRSDIYRVNKLYECSKEN